MGTVMVVTDDTFEAAVLASARPVLVEYWARWCPPCRQLSPVLDALATELAGRLDVAKLNTDENPRITREHAIMLVPTLHLFRDGTVVKQLVGARSRSALARELSDHL